MKYVTHHYFPDNRLTLRMSKRPVLAATCSAVLPCSSLAFNTPQLCDLMMALTSFSAASKGTHVRQQHVGTVRIKQPI